MLVVTRREGDQLVIGDGPDRVVITVVDIVNPDTEFAKARLGIDRPDGVPVHKQELAPHPWPPEKE